MADVNADADQEDGDYDDYEEEYETESAESVPKKPSEQKVGEPAPAVIEEPKKKKLKKKPPKKKLSKPESEGAIDICVSLVVKLAKVLLVLVNFVLMILGIIFFLCGALMADRMKLFTKWEEKIKGNLEGLEEFGVNVDTSQLKLEEFLRPFCYVLIGFGAGIIIVSLLGIYGPCTSTGIALLLYTFFVIIALLVFLAVYLTLVFDQSEITKELKVEMKKSLKKYHSLVDISSTSMTWNGVMLQYECCGVENSKDFAISLWNKSEFIKGRNHKHLKTPIVCCKKLKRAIRKSDFACSQNATKANNNMNKGCYDKIFYELRNTPIVTTCIAMMIGFLNCVIFISLAILMLDKDISISKCCRKKETQPPPKGKKK